MEKLFSGRIVFEAGQVVDRCSECSLYCGNMCCGIRWGLPGIEMHKKGRAQGTCQSMLKSAGFNYSLYSKLFM